VGRLLLGEARKQHIAECAQLADRCGELLLHLCGDNSCLWRSARMRWCCGQNRERWPVEGVQNDHKLLLVADELWPNLVANLARGDRRKPEGDVGVQDGKD
jgi:hypothetical protein